MKKNFKPNTWLYPQPVLVIASYGADGTADGMVAAWGGIYDTNPVGFMLDPTHKTVANSLGNDGGSGLSGNRVGKSCTR